MRFACCSRQLQSNWTVGDPPSASLIRLLLGILSCPHAAYANSYLAELYTLSFKSGRNFFAGHRPNQPARTHMPEMGEEKEVGETDTENEKEDTLRSVAVTLAAIIIFLSIGQHFGSNARARSATSMTDAGRRGLRKDAVPRAVSDHPQKSSDNPLGLLPPTTPEYTSEKCKPSKFHSAGLACPVPPNIEAAQRTAAEENLKELPWMKVYDKTPRMKTDGKGRLVVEDWNPPENYMLDWAKKAVKDALQPWSSYIDPFQMDAFKARAGGRGGCFLKINDGNVGGCSIGGSNGRYITLLKEAAHYLKTNGRHPKDSRIIVTKGDDEPSVPIVPDAASQSIPLVRAHCQHHNTIWLKPAPPNMFRYGC